MKIEAEILLPCGLKALIDADDLPRVEGIKWHAVAGKKYAAAWIGPSKKQKHVYLHRFLLNAKRGIEVDHKNGNGLDCRKENLRLATSKQNSWNIGKYGVTSSKFVGVCWHRRTGKWYAYINDLAGKRKHLGVFISESDAARARDEAAMKLRGEFARLNFQEAS